VARFSHGPGQAVARSFQLRENVGVLYIGQLRQNRRDTIELAFGFAVVLWCGGF
jgi:hypothetical protein